MMEKLAQAGEAGGARPAAVTLSNIKYKVVVYRTLPYFYSTPMCTLCPYLKKSLQYRN
jgi:hypothetical protein